MATTAAETRSADKPAVALPLFYKSLFPLSAKAHGRLILAHERSYSFAQRAGSIPLVTEEFAIAQRFYPIVFSADALSLPMALMGLKPNHNEFIDETGKWRAGTYVPAYVRRYPFLLVKKTQEAEDYALCIDASARMVELGADGNLFEDGEPSKLARDMLQFCTDYERGARNTRAFVKALQAHDLLIDGDIKIKAGPGVQAPLKVNGFRIVSEPRLRALPAEALHELNAQGWLMPIHAHLLSLGTFSTLPRPDGKQRRMTLSQTAGSA